MKTLADYGAQLEHDTLSHWEPMEVITYGAGNVIKLPLAGDESCSRV